MLDPWWNPAVENQAYDRVHRLGQTREVIVTRYIARESMEERVLELQARKQRMADAMLESSAKGNSGDRITFQDLLTLLP
jgi:SNF2 family DNA or RNA helicase